MNLFYRMIEARIKEICDAEGITLKDLAMQLDIPKSNVQRYANGEAKPSYEFIVALYKKGINTEWLFSGIGEMYQAKNLGKNSHIANLIQWLQYLDQTADPQILNWLEVEIASRFPDYNQWRESQGMPPLKRMDTLTRLERFFYEKMTDEERARFFPPRS